MITVGEMWNNELGPFQNAGKIQAVSILSLPSDLRIPRKQKGQRPKGFALNNGESGARL
jgi:hypothetical protein